MSGERIGGFGRNYFSTANLNPALWAQMPQLQATTVIQPTLQLPAAAFTPALDTLVALPSSGGMSPDQAAVHAILVRVASEELGLSVPAAQQVVNTQLSEWVTQATGLIASGEADLEDLEAEFRASLGEWAAVSSTGQALEAEGAQEVTNDLLDPSKTSPLEQQGNHVFSPEELYPWIAKFAEEYGVDPKVMAALIYQESGFKNYLVHNDGTGHGLIGLDDNGLLSDFEQWAGMSVGRGASARPIPPELQIEYLAQKLASMAAGQGGDIWAACRQWHRGPGLMNDSRGQNYEQLLKSHISRLFGDAGFPDVEVPPDSPIQPGGYTGDPNVGSLPDTGGGQSYNPTTGVGTGPSSGSYNPANATPVQPARIVDESALKDMSSSLLQHLLETDKKRFDALKASLQGSTEFQEYCEAQGASPDDPAAMLGFLAEKLGFLDVGAGGKFGKFDLKALHEALKAVGFDVDQLSPEMRAQVDEALAALEQAALDATSAPVRAGNITSKTEADRVHLTQWGPTPTNSNGAPFGFNDCGPTGLGIALMALGKVARPAPGEAAAFIDQMRDRMLGYDSKSSQLTNFDQIARGARSFGARAEVVNVDQIDQVLANGGVIVGSGRCWNAWGAQEKAKGNYLNSQDPGLHVVTIVGKTATGNYLVCDPLTKGGAMEVSPSQLRNYLGAALAVY